MEYELPNLVENLFLIAIAVIGIGGFVLFWVAMGMPAIEGPWQTINALMSWLTIIVLLVLGAQLEGIRKVLKERRRK